MEYKKAVEMARSARSAADGKPVANNTRLVMRGDSVALRLHSTDIVLFKPRGAVVLNSGGWKTVTTKARMNEFAARVWSERGTWHASVYGKSAPFADGMTFYPSGKITGAGRIDLGTREKKTRKQASEYARVFVDKLYAGEIPAPSAGDCWHCVMRDKAGTPLGELTRDASHVHGHLTEKYYVPSLLVNALKMFGASVAATQTAHAFMQNQVQHAFSRDRADFIAKQIEKCVRRYVLRQLGLAS